MPTYLTMRHPLSIYIRSVRRAGERLLGKIERRLRYYLGIGFVASVGEAQRDKRPVIDLATLETALRELGLSSGDSVLVHSGTSHLGKISGGARGIFELIQKTVGEHGNVLYPVFPFGGLIYEYLRSNPVFDVNTAPSKMGSLTEYALRAPGGRRSIHPTHSVLAFGESSDFFVGEHHLCPTPFSDQSPFAKLVERSGKILLLGVGLNSTTSFHRIEDKLGGRYLVKIYLDEVFTVRCTDVEGRELQVRTQSHDPFISRVRDGDLVRDAFVRSGVLREISVGNGSVGIIDAKAMEDCLEDLCLNQRFTIYGKIWG
ncbi:MAG: AAC(3) family N-acetyltransferase [Methylococcaceae bacterium]|nr:AAC(3) family N-acetyltransferase [Methylococcaceae bacterium]